MTIGKVKKALEQFVNDRTAQSFFLTGKVTAVDKDTATCDVSPIDGSTEYQDVRLLPIADTSSIGILTYPKEGSIVGLIRINEEEAVVWNCQEIEHLEVEVAGKFKLVVDKDGTCSFNDGDNGGLIIVDKLRQEIDKNSQMLQTILSVLSVPVVEAGGGAPSALQQVLNAALQGKSTANLSSITNDKIKH